MSGARLKALAWVLFPVLLSLFLYRRSFRIWFLADDFAWLGLRLSVFSAQDFLAALFTPMAQGTIRTFSERLFFLGFESVFGLESLPMRIWMFATLAVAEIFLVLVVRRLTASWWAGTLAAILWSLNFGVTAAMSWLSSYNQILLSALILSGLYLFMRYAEERSFRWLAASWFVYLVGFGTLESIIVFPALLLVWAVLFDRSVIRTTAPFFAPAVAFTLAHLFVIPKEVANPAYRMHFDGKLFESVSVYWGWLLGVVKLSHFDPGYAPTVTPILWIVTIGIICFTVWRSLLRDYVPLFGAILSAALIAPMLPLSDHRTDYYLASASIGFMILLAAIPLRLEGAARWAGVAIVLLYAFPSFVLQAATFEWYLERSGPVRVLLRGLKYASREHPGKLLLVEGVSQDLYWSAMADDALRLVNAQKVRLAPGEGPEGNPLRISPVAVRTAFEHDAVIVYRLQGDKLRDVTSSWAQGKALELRTGWAPVVDAGDPIYAGQFAAGWYAIENSSRWMAAEASLHLGGPFAAGGKFFLKAYCPRELGSVKLSVQLNGAPAIDKTVTAGEVTLELPLAQHLRSEKDLLVTIRCAKTVHEGAKGRELSLVFGQIGVR